MDASKKEPRCARGGGAPVWLARCPGCGYDLEGIEAPRHRGIEAGENREEKAGAIVCPECGWVATSEERARLWAAWRFARKSRVRAGVGVGAAVAASCGGWVFAGMFVGLDGVYFGVATGFVLVAAALGCVAALFARRGCRDAAAMAWLRLLPLLLLGFVVFPVIAAPLAWTPGAGAFEECWLTVPLTVSGLVVWLAMLAHYRFVGGIEYGTRGVVALVGVVGVLVLVSAVPLTIWMLVW